MRPRILMPTLRLAGIAVLCLGILVSPGRVTRAASEQAPSAPATFPAGVDIITVDAVVLDSQGRPVGGLSRDDFTVFEDDRAQDIVGFEAFTGDEGAAAVSGSPSAVSSNEGESRPAGRAFVILLDDLRIAPARAVSARQAAALFLERSVRDGDEVTLGTTSGDAWWSARIPEGREDLLAVLGRFKGRYVESNSLDRMSEYEAFWINSHEDTLPHVPLEPDRPASAPAQQSAHDPNQALGSVKERVKLRWKDANLCTGTSCDGMVRDLATEINRQRKGRTGAAFDAIRRGLEAVAPVRGRKSLLLFSEGFIDDPDTSRGAVLLASRKANTAVYFVDVRGLVALSSVGSAADAEQLTSARDRTTSAFEDTVLESAGAEALAEDTGGFSVRNTNDLAMGAERIARESRVFYLLGFYPLPGKPARDWRKLRVEVRGPGLRVRARRGYNLGAGADADRAARKRGTEGQGRKGAPDPAILRALDSAHDGTDIPLRVIAYVFEPVQGDATRKDTTRVVVAAEFDAGAVPGAEKGHGPARKLDLSIVATHRDTGRESRFDEVVGVPATAAGPNWRAVAPELSLPSGVSQVRVVARDPASGAIGSVSQRFEVPPENAFRLSTPILTDRMEPAEGGGKARPRPALCAHRVFEPAGGLYLQFEVFGAARAAGAAPRVSAGLTLSSTDGRVARSAPPTPIAPDPDGRLVRFVGIGLDGLDQGLYDLSLDVRDETSGERLEHHEPVTLAGDAAAR